MSARLYYVCGYVLDGHRAHFLWFTNDTDGVELTAAGRLLTFTTEIAVKDHAQAYGLTVAVEPAVWYDLDQVAEWCEAPTADAIDCQSFLDVWNLLGDLGVAADSVFRAADRRTSPVYDKLFFGNNLPSVTPADTTYAPSWSKQEIVELARVLRLGLAEFRGKLPAAAA